MQFIKKYFVNKYTLGSFFHMYHTIEEGSYQLNPPFVETVLERVVQCILFLLEKSERSLAQKPLSFFCVVPNWDNAGGCHFLKLLQNTTKFLVTQIVLKPQHHFFTSSSQKAFVQVLSSEQLYKHCFTPYPLGEYNFPSIGSTFLFILQNNVGKKKWPITPSIVSKMQTNCS
jgi:hypothetical protein